MSLACMTRGIARDHKRRRSTTRHARSLCNTWNSVFQSSRCLASGVDYGLTKQADLAVDCAGDIALVVSTCVTAIGLTKHSGGRQKGSGPLILNVRS